MIYQRVMGTKKDRAHALSQVMPPLQGWDAAGYAGVAGLIDDNQGGLT